RQRLQAIIRLGDAVGVESIRANDVRTSLQKLLVNVVNDLRPGQVENVVIALEVAWVVFETVAAEIGFGELERLDHGPARTVKDDDPLAQPALEMFNFVRHRFDAN